MIEFLVSVLICASPTECVLGQRIAVYESAEACVEGETNRLLATVQAQIWVSCEPTGLST